MGQNGYNRKSGFLNDNRPKAVCGEDSGIGVLLGRNKSKCGHSYGRLPGN